MFYVNCILFCLAEISNILSFDKPNDWSLEVYKNFLTIFIGSFYGSCRDLVELKHLVILKLINRSLFIINFHYLLIFAYLWFQANLLFAKYIEPIQDGSCAEFNQNLLFRKISPTIQLLLNNVYLGTRYLWKRKCLRPSSIIVYFDYIYTKYIG